MLNTLSFCSRAKAFLFRIFSDTFFTSFKTLFVGVISLSVIPAQPSTGERPNLEKEDLLTAPLPRPLERARHQRRSRAGTKALAPLFIGCVNDQQFSVVSISSNCPALKITPSPRDHHPIHPSDDWSVKDAKGIGTG